MNACTVGFQVSRMVISRSMLVAVLAILTFSSAAKPDQTPVNLEPSIVRMVNQTVQPGVEVCVPIELVAQGNEADVGFSMQFDPTILIYKEIKLGSAFPLGEVVPNIDSAAEGLIGIAVMLNQSLGIPAGTYTVVEVCFTVANVVTAVQTELHCRDRPYFMQVADNMAQEREALWQDGKVMISPPQIQTAVSRKTHGVAGTFNIDLLSPLPDANMATECRDGGPVKLVVTFSEAIQGVGGLDIGDVTLSSGTVSGLVIDGSTLTINMTGAADGVPLVVRFPGIASAVSEERVFTNWLCFGVTQSAATSHHKVNVIYLFDI